MQEEHYEAGNEDACTDMGLEKEAFVGALRSGAKALAGRVGGKIGPKAIGEKVTPYTTKAEEGVAKGVGKALGPTAEKSTRGLIRGTGKEMLGQAAGGAALVGGLQGGIGAMTAPEGQGTEQFFKGLGQGALMGTGYGLAGGAAAGPIKNLRRKSLQQMANRRAGVGKLQAHSTNKLSPANSAPQLAEKQLNRGFFGSAKDLATGKGPLGRSGAAANMLGGPTQIGGEFMAGEALMLPFGMSLFNDQPPESTPTPANMRSPRQHAFEYKTGAAPVEPSQQTSAPAPIIGSVLGGGLGGLSTRLLVNAAKAKGKMPGGAGGATIEHAAPFMGSASGTLSGYYAGTEMQPKPEVNWEEKLNKIDFDKLMRYYKKREADQG